MSTFIQEYVDLAEPGPGGVTFVALGTSYERRTVYVYADTRLSEIQRRAITERYGHLRDVVHVRFDAQPDPTASGPDSCSD